MRLNMERIKPHCSRMVSRALPATAIAGFLLVMGLVGSEDMAEQQRAADSYAKRVCLGIHDDYKARNPACDEVAAR